MKTAIWWIRRDLRLADNPALHAALLAEAAVLPVFILDPHLLAKSAPLRQAFLFDGLRALDDRLRELGSHLVVRRGRPPEELARLARESKASLITAQEDYSPYARQRDDLVARQLPLQLFSGQTVHPPAAVARPGGRPYAVFTAFSKAWKALPFPGKPAPYLPERFPPPDWVNSLPIPAAPILSPFPAGEIEAHRRLDAFLSGPVYTYSEDRNRMDKDGTSELSPYFRFGMLSARQAAWAVMDLAARAAEPQARLGCETWLNELIWREFYQSVLFHNPAVLHQSFNPALRLVPWRDAPQELHAWQNGLTGFPVVDASMRQLTDRGWMHNRGRMITASFLVKDLLLNWQAGEKWFMRHLVDGDPAANNGGWQWSAGVGTDAAPYFRIFNPISQGQKCDPDGRFIRRWLPELAHVPGDFIHQPWLMPAEIQRRFGCQIGRDYPLPMLDHLVAKARTLAVFKQAYQSRKSND